MMKFIGGASVSALAIAAAPAAAAQGAAAPAEQNGQREGGVPAIIVTAQKRTQDLQDVPISVSAIGEEQLDELNISTFDDYLEQLPTVTAGGTGSGSYR